MVNLIAWLGVHFVLLVFLGKRRIHWYWAIVMVSYILIPNVSRGVYFPLLHPASWAVLLGYAYNIAVYPRRVSNWIFHSRYLAFAILGICIVISASIFSPYSGGLKSVASFLLVIIVCPVLLSIAIRGTLKVDPRREKIYMCFFMLTMVFEAVLALVQYDQKEFFFYQGALESQWFATEGGALSRAVGTTGHGLQLAACLVIAIAMTLRIRSVFLRLALCSLFMVSIPPTNARAQLITGTAVFAFVLLVSVRQKITVALPMGALSVAGIFEYINTSEAGQELLEKFESDGGSAQKRVQAYQWFSTHASEMIWQGYPGSRATRESGILTSTLENGYLMFALNFGIVLMCVYALIQLCVIVSRFMNHWELNYPALLACIVTIGTSLNSSSFMGESVEGPYIWILLGLASLSPVTSRAVSRDKILEQELETTVRTPVAAH